MARITILHEINLFLIKEQNKSWQVLKVTSLATCPTETSPKAWLSRLSNSLSACHNRAGHTDLEEGSFHNTAQMKCVKYYQNTLFRGETINEKQYRWILLTPWIPLYNEQILNEMKVCIWLHEVQLLCNTFFHLRNPAQKLPSIVCFCSVKYCFSFSESFNIFFLFHPSTLFAYACKK